MDLQIFEIIPSYLGLLVKLIVTSTVALVQWVLPGCFYAKKVDQDTVLITGAGSGLGREIALEYARLGSSLVLWDINEGGLKQTKTLVQIEHRQAGFTNKLSLIQRVDVSDKEDVRNNALQLKQRLQESSHDSNKYVSVLVNNAGIYHGLLLHELKDEQIERIFRINILAHFWTVRAFLPAMIENKKGHIVEVASMGGICGLAKQVDYSATKFATVGFEESLSVELELLGLSEQVKTTVVCPFFFASNLFTGFTPSSTNSLMGPDYVAREAVMAMRCNHAKVMLPKLRSNIIWLVKALTTRDFLLEATKMSGLLEGIRTIKGKAAQIAT